MSPEREELLLLLADVITLCHRKNLVHYAEQRSALLLAAQQAQSTSHFLEQLFSFGIPQNAQLTQLVRSVLASPPYYRALYAKTLLCIPDPDGTQTLLTDQRVFFAAEPFLSVKQRKVFEEDVWDFRRNHQATIYHPTKGTMLGVYAGESQERTPVMERFEEFMRHRCSLTTVKMRTRYDEFPLDILLLVLRRGWG